MARDAVRAIVLCEDARHRSFLISLLDRLGIAPITISVAPSGKGSAEQWVRLQLPKEVKAFRSRANHQQNLVLVVMTDGDRFGVRARKASLDDELRAGDLAVRGRDERIVYLVPTWSIETWLIWLSKSAVRFEEFGETAPYRDDVEYKRLDRAGEVSSTVAVANWATPLLDEPRMVPSLTDGRTELRRVP